MSFIQKSSKTAVLKDDLKTIRQGGADLARHIKEDASHIAEAAMAEGQSKLDDLTSFAAKTLRVIEKQVTAKPLQSMAIAVGAGALLALFLRRG